MVNRNAAYLNTQGLLYLADLPGARVEQNRLAVSIENAETPLDVSAETVPVSGDGPLDVSAETVPVSGDGPLDVSAETVPTFPAPYLPDSAKASIDRDFDATDNSGAPFPTPAVVETLTHGRGERVTGVVKSPGSYDVRVASGDPSRQLIDVTDVALGVGGGQTTRIDERALTPTATVIITDQSGDTTNSVSGEVRML